MSYNGWTNDSTWGVAGACDNTEAFQTTRAAIASRARNGDVAGAAAQLQDHVQTRGQLAATLPSWVDFAAVNWAELVTGWAGDDAA